ncbi:MAG: HD domain-containing protein [Candidatus Hermodarchaeota archaeon]
MSLEEIIRSVRNFAYEKSKKDDIHGFRHVERVLKRSMEIGKILNANLTVIKIAALLHDVGRYVQKSDRVKNHAEISAEIAKEFLTKSNFSIKVEDLDNILHCIRSHSFSNELEPKTIEAKILHDSDKLDAIGAIGLYRTIGFTLQNYGGIRQVIGHLENKILRLKDLMYLDISKEMADTRHKLVLDFYNQIKKELD